MAFATPARPSPDGTKPVAATTTAAGATPGGSKAILGSKAHLGSQGHGHGYSRTGVGGASSARMGGGGGVGGSKAGFDRRSTAGIHISRTGSHVPTGKNRSSAALHDPSEPPPMEIIVDPYTQTIDDLRELHLRGHFDDIPFDRTDYDMDCFGFLEKSVESCSEVLGLEMNCTVFGLTSEDGAGRETLVSSIIELALS